MENVRTHNCIVCCTEFTFSLVSSPIQFINGGGKSIIGRGGLILYIRVHRMFAGCPDTLKSRDSAACSNLNNLWMSKGTMRIDDH